MIYAQDDFVEYHLYVDALPDKDEPISLLESCIVKYKQFLSPLLDDYIWQRDPFVLKIFDPSKKKKFVKGDIPHIWGRTRFGDNIDDEWFIVYMLLELTKNFKDLTVSVADNDGQFLLIEAALALPRWVKPENSVNRVFLRNGHIHIIPLPSTPAQLALIPVELDISKALHIVRDSTVPTEAPQGVDDAVWRRVNKVASDRQLLQHHNVKVIVPVDVAHLLRTAPSLVAPAVTAFYDRDMDDMKSCAKMEQFPPTPSVATRVRFTRCLYSQLHHQRFHPPRCFPPLPPPSSPDYKAAELGIKLACAFQILYARSKASSFQEHTPTIEEYNWHSDDNWKRYRASLQDMGYFKGELEGSQLYKQLERTAKQNYLASGLYKKSKNGRFTGTLAQFMDKVLQDTPPPTPENWPPPTLLDDSDEWLQVDPHEIDRLVQERMALDSRKNTTKSSNNTDNRKKLKKNKKDKMEDFTEGDMLDDIAGDINKFVRKISDYEGAEFPGETEDMSDVQFDPARFMKIMKETLGMEGELDDDMDDLDLEESENEFGSDEEGSSDEEVANEMHFEGMDSDSENEDIYASLLSQYQSQGQATGKEHKEKDKTSKATMSHLMRQMDEELQSTQVKEGGEVDVDTNLVKNLLDSYAVQHGLPGPASTLLAELKDRKS